MNHFQVRNYELHLICERLKIHINLGASKNHISFLMYHLSLCYTNFWFGFLLDFCGFTQFEYIFLSFPPVPWYGAYQSTDSLVDLPIKEKIVYIIKHLKISKVRPDPNNNIPQTWKPLKIWEKKEILHNWTT